MPLAAREMATGRMTTAPCVRSAGLWPMKCAKWCRHHYDYGEEHQSLMDVWPATKPISRGHEDAKFEEIQQGEDDPTYRPKGISLDSQVAA